MLLFSDLLASSASSASSVCPSQRSHQPPPPVSGLHGGIVLAAPAAALGRHPSLKCQRLSDKTHIICCNKHFLDSIHWHVSIIFQIFWNDLFKNFTPKPHRHFFALLISYNINPPLKADIQIIDQMMAQIMGSLVGWKTNTRCFACIKISIIRFPFILMMKTII